MIYVKFCSMISFLCWHKQRYQINMIYYRSRSLTMHLTKLAIREDQIGTNHSNLTREHIVNNTSILRKQNDINRLLINEANLIKLEKPEITAN